MKVYGPAIVLSLLSLAQTPAERGFVEKSIEVDGTEYRYQIFVPESWSPLEKWPVVLFLHGAGERGTDGRAQTEVGIGPAIRRDPSRFPAVVVMPQCRRGVWWNDETMERLALGTLEEAIAQFNGDPNRIYLTGLSMGGYGTFHFAAAHPGRFAALVPICGGITPPQVLRREGNPADEAGGPYRLAAAGIGATPVWIFHGEADPVVPVSESRRMAKALEEAGAAVRYTEYEGVGHNSWDRAYAEPGLLTWMLSQRR
jgi:predicted peptidase